MPQRGFSGESCARNRSLSKPIALVNTTGIAAAGWPRRSARSRMTRMAETARGGRAWPGGGVGRGGVGGDVRVGRVLPQALLQPLRAGAPVRSGLPGQQQQAGEVTQHAFDLGM